LEAQAGGITDVVSELSKVKAGKAHRNVAAWNESVAPVQTYLSSITIHELELGALLLERKDRPQGAVVRAWLDTRVLPEFEGLTRRYRRSSALRKIACAGPKAAACWSAVRRNIMCLARLVAMSVMEA
jgi:predicted nucleic acid-binding protein